MSSKENSNREAQNSARPPEYTIIRRQTSARSDAQPAPQYSKQNQRNKRDARFEESETRREQRREQRYRAKRRRQWVLALVIVAVFIGLLALALHFITSRPTSATPAASEPALTASLTQSVEATQTNNTEYFRLSLRRQTSRRSLQPRVNSPALALCIF